MRNDLLEQVLCRGGIRMKRLIRFWNPLFLITVFINTDFSYRDALLT